MRYRNTNRHGQRFSRLTVEAVWNKGQIVPGHNPSVTRKDSCGAYISKSRYGETVPNGSGWEIDHIIPVSKGGTDDISNLQPLQWENNRRKTDNYPHWDCAVRAAA